MAAQAVLVVVHGDAEIVIGPLPDTRPDLELVDALARVQLAMRRLGCSIRVRDASSGLLEVIELAGLADCLGIEPRREAERREQLGVQEVVDTGDSHR